MFRRCGADQVSTLNISRADHFREVILHAHEDLRAGMVMLRRLRLPTAWEKIRCACDRLGAALSNHEQ